MIGMTSTPLYDATVRQTGCVPHPEDSLSPEELAIARQDGVAIVLRGAVAMVAINRDPATGRFVKSRRLDLPIPKELDR